MPNSKILGRLTLNAIAVGSIWFNFLVNLLAGAIAYFYHPKEPALDLNDKGLTALPQAIS